jgi:uncharacterized protein (TIGR02646 family)
MMKIPFVAPDLDPADVKKAAELVAGMNSLVALLSASAKAPGNRFAILGPEQRADLRGRGYPALLVNNLAYFTEQVRVSRADGSLVEEYLPMTGFTANAFDGELYASDAIRRSLVASHRGRCAYCETLIDQASYGDVEHFRPKAAYTTRWAPTMFRPAYHALAYDPQNLYYSCQLCNQAYKKNDFEVIGQRYPEIPLAQERPLLINPYTEDPRQLIRFNPANARAYAFDVALAFYAATQGWGPPQVGAELWKDPSLIPGQTDHRGIDITNPQVTVAYGAWLATASDPQLRRGTGTIGTLGLNRRALVRSRASHLRQLRGLLWAGAGGSSADNAAAQKLLSVLAANGPGVANVAPQYVSLSIDAANTWLAQGTNPQDWIGTYNAILEALAPVADTPVAPPAGNDALMFLVLDDEVALAGRRRIVYLSDSDKLYGNSGGHKGVFLSIDWQEELEAGPPRTGVEIVRDGVIVESMSLPKFVAELNGNPRTAYSRFRNANVWAVGNFKPFAARTQ